MDAEDPDATYYPVGKLMYARVKPDNDFSAWNFKLVYRFEIKTLEPLHQFEVMIDVKNGNLIRKQSLIHHAWGTVNTMYNGQRNFTTQWRGFPNNDYVLKDTDSGDKLHTLLWDTNAWEWRPEVDDNDNVWSEPAATTHWAVQMAWNYFITEQSRNGMDGAGGKIRIEAESPDQLNASYWRSGGYDYVSFGRTPTGVNGSMAALDIVGHEFTHGVTNHASALGSTGESGALHESFSDIFGVMVERSIQGIEDWVMGDDTGFRARSLQDPNLTFPETNQWFDPSPDTYLGDFWDFGGDTHRNNGVQNFWFFLLANGGTGTNDNGQPYNIQGIGIIDAARIAYKNIDLYIQSSSNYADARAGAINAATWWFGACSNQVTQTTNAWAAVGVGATAGTCPISGNITGPQVATYYQYCSWTMNPTGGNGVYTYQWQRSEDFGSTWWNVSTLKTYSAYAFNAASTNTHLKLRCTVSSGTQTQVFNHTVDCTDCSFGFSALQTNVNIIDESSAEQENTKMVKSARQRDVSNNMHDEEVPIELTVFPNPASYWLSIRLFTPRKEENLVLIVDAMGKIVARNIVESEENTMNIGDLSPGIYLVVLTNSNGRWIEKLIIKK